MTLEPSQIRTVCIRPVMPPKPPRATPKPRLSLAEDAEMIRTRFNKKWGRYADYTEHDNDPNEARRKAAAARREQLSETILALLTQNGPTTAKNLMAQTRQPEEQIRHVMRLLDKAHKIIMGPRTRDGHLWNVAQPTQDNLP